MGVFVQKKKTSTTVVKALVAVVGFAGLLYLTVEHLMSRMSRQEQTVKALSVVPPQRIKVGDGLFLTDSQNCTWVVLEERQKLHLMRLAKTDDLACGLVDK